MVRKAYIFSEELSLCEYIHSIDDINGYNCWRNEDTERGFNFRMSSTFEEFSKQPVRSRFLATIVRCADNTDIGQIFLSSENTLPDLAIMLYKSYRGMGYGTQAFALGAEYCFDKLGFDRIYAGCYPDNFASHAMLIKCGFERNPGGDTTEKHYLMGEEIVQKDFVRQRALSQPTEHGV
jgi:Acetyltransferases, including N-acetylases of ribosomal proteins